MTGDLELREFVRVATGVYEIHENGESIGTVRKYRPLSHAWAGSRWRFDTRLPNGGTVTGWNHLTRKAAAVELVASRESGGLKLGAES